MGIDPLKKSVNAADIAPERLAGNTALTEQQKIAEASRQFEAILLRQILSATQKPVIPSKYADNSTAASIYRDMVTTQLADSISKSGSFGLAQTFEHQLTRPVNGESKPGAVETPSRDAATTAVSFGHTQRQPRAAGPVAPAKPFRGAQDF
jgi:flagellar protein FlgJ